MSALAARRRANIAGWGLSAPFTAILAVFLLVPILASLALSFTSFSIGNIQDWTSAEFVGLDNYTKLFGDDMFMRSLRNTAYFVRRRRAVHDRDRRCCWPSRSTRASASCAGCSGSASTCRWSRASWRSRSSGATCSTRTSASSTRRSRRSASPGPDWLGNPNTTMPSIIALGVWRNIGNSMVIFLAALQTVDPQLYEAARVDGAKGRQLFRHVTVPMLRPAILFATVITTIGYLQVFEEPFVMTGPSGGPTSPASPTSLFVYQQGFRFFNLGYASAGGVHAVHLHRRPGDHPVPLPEDEVMTVAADCPGPRARRRAPSASRARSRAARRGGCSSLLFARAWSLMIGPFVWMLLGAFKTNADFIRTTPTLLPEKLDAGQLQPAVLQAGLLPLLPQLARGIAIVVTRGQPAVLLDGRLRAGQAEVRRPPAADGRSRWRR